jgi:ribosomal protein L40E
MKRVLLLCAFFMGSLAFACDSPLHEMFHEAASLKSSGYHAEAADLLSDITGADICNFSPGEMRCYNSAARELSLTQEKYICRKCRTEHDGYVSKCKRCKSTDLYIKPPTWMNL